MRRESSPATPLLGHPRLGAAHDVHDLLDAVWLARLCAVEQSALTFDPTSSRDEATPLPAPSPAIPAVVPRSDLKPRLGSPLSSGSAPKVEIYHGPVSEGAPLRISGAAALCQSRALTRALQPLRRRVPGRALSIDEEATAMESADLLRLLPAQRGHLWPVLRAESERHLEVALIIDSAGTLQVFWDAIAELLRLLQRHSAFSGARPFTLETSGIPTLRGGPPWRPRQWHRLDELLHPGGRRLVLVVSDCVASGWRSGVVPTLLARLSRRSPRRLPPTVVQVLPPWLWSRSALSAYPLGTVTADPGGKPLIFDSPAFAFLPPPLRPRGVPLPVISLEPGALAAWAGLLSGATGAVVPAVLVTDPCSGRAEGRSGIASLGGATEQVPAPGGGLEAQVKDPLAGLPTALQRLRRFRDGATEVAQRLAELLACVPPPLSPQLLRLVQEVMLPKESLHPIAEVLLGGLLCALDTPFGTHRAVSFDFYPGVRALLRERLPSGEAGEVRRRLGRYLEHRLGAGYPLPAWVRHLDSATAGFAPFDAVLAEQAGAIAASPQSGRADSTAASRPSEQAEDVTEASPLPELGVDVAVPPLEQSAELMLFTKSDGNASSAARARHPVSDQRRVVPHLGDDVGAARLAALERLARGWTGAPGELLASTAALLHFRVVSVEDDHLRIELPELALALPSRETALFLLSGDATAREALERRIGALPLRLPALVVLREGEETPRLVGAVVLREADLRAIAWDRRPERALAALLWQRADLRALSPYQTSGDVRDQRMFFGRDMELRELSSAGKRRAVLVIGPRKVGKSSLLRRAEALLRERNERAVYVVLRETVATPGQLAEKLAQRAGAAAPVLPADWRGQCAVLGAVVREHLLGALLLLDEADQFLERDRQEGRACAEELRALVQEGACSLVLAGYDTLYRAALSQSETAYNLGDLLFLGPLERGAAVQLSVEPLERMGATWSDGALPERLVDALGGLPDLLQAAGRLLLLRLCGERAPTLSAGDLDAVLGGWCPPGEVEGMRQVLVSRVEVNLQGPAQAAVWLMADQEKFGLSALHGKLSEAGFPLDSDGLNLLAQRLILSGICRREGDIFRFSVPLLRHTIIALDVPFRINQRRGSGTTAS